jgi:hypothetical protein
MVIVGVSIVVAIAVAVIVRAVQGSGGSSAVDGALKRSADRVLPQLNHSGGKLPITDSSLRSFQAWVYDTQPVLANAARTQHNSQRLQLQFTDPSTLPPQTPLVSLPGTRTVAIDPGVAAHVLQTKQPEYTTVHQVSGPDLRVYLVPLQTPAALLQAQCSGLLEVIQAVH